MVETTGRRIGGVFVQAHKQTQQQLGKASGTLADQVLNDIDSNLKDILEEAKKRLKHGFDVTLEFPKPNINVNVSSLVAFNTDIVEQKSESFTVYHEQSGGWAETKRWFADLFDTKWGYERVTQWRDFSTVDLSAIRDQAMRILGAFESEMQAQADVFVSSVLRKAVDDHFNALTAYLEEFRGDLVDALNDKNLKADRLAALDTKIRELKLEVENLLHDGLALQEALEAA